MMWWNHNGWGFGDWLAMSTMMVLFWGLLTALVWLVLSSRNESAAPRAQEGLASRSADLVLAERFARGEIDEDELTRSLAVLHNAGSSKVGR